MNFLSDIVNTLNRLLYVKPKTNPGLFSKEDILKARKRVSSLLYNVLAGKITVLEALKNFPKNVPDDSTNVCFHVLVHYEADEDIRAKDSVYAQTQNEFMLEIAGLLASGENLPINIIKEYNDFYSETLLYPEINRDTVISRLKKFINI